MEQKLAKIFKSIRYRPESDRTEEIWQAIVSYEKRTTRFKLLFFSFFGFVSLIALVPAVGKLLSDFSQSGFYEYLSLAFSNSGSVITYWKDFVSLLAESLPVLSIVLLLGLIFVFLISAKYA